MAAFELSKWYLDCVTDSGDVSIAYTGMVNWGPIRLHYSSLLESTAGLVGAKHSLRPQGEPKFEECALRWRSGALKIDGEWQADSPEIRETIFVNDAGSIEWHCRMPRAQARLHNRLGFGYAEHLNMTIAPWKLPIRTLRWGRFAAASDWIVWIDWLGEFTRRIVYWNGQIAPPPSSKTARSNSATERVLLWTAPSSYVKARSVRQHCLPCQEFGTRFQRVCSR